MTTRNVIVILGSTASGKSSLGVKLAKRFHGVIISADSRQVYRGMDLGTGKITKREMNGVPHYLLDVASPRTQYSVARYVRDVVKVLKLIPLQTPIFLVGGSPFYIDALTKPNSFSSVPPNQKLRRWLAKKTLRQLIGKLRKLNPDRLATIDVANRRRLIRAIEIASYHTPPLMPSLSTRRATTRSGEEAVSRRGRGEVALPQFRLLKLGLTIDKKKLYRNIARRVDTRMRQGMLREVDRLHKQGLSWKKLDAFGLEYRFLARFLQKKLTKVEAIQQLNNATRDFAKRQMMWWKRDQEIYWLTKKSQAQLLVRNRLRG